MTTAGADLLRLQALDSEVDVARRRLATAVDAAVKAFGLPMGPFVLADALGLDVCWDVAQTLYDAGEPYGTEANVAKLIAAQTATIQRCWRVIAMQPCWSSSPKRPRPRHCARPRNSWSNQGCLIWV